MVILLVVSMKGGPTNGYGGMIIRQSIIVIISLCFFAVPVAVSNYIVSHVVQPCSIENVLAQTCALNSNLATWLNLTRNWYATTSIFSIQTNVVWKIDFFSSTVAGRFGQFLSPFVILLILVFFLNAIYFLTLGLFRYIQEHTSAK